MADRGQPDVDDRTINKGKARGQDRGRQHEVGVRDRRGGSRQTRGSFAGGAATMKGLALASLACATAPSLGVLLAGRLLQGVGAAPADVKQRS